MLLVVEDDLMTREMLQRQLRTEDIKILEASSGNQALDIMRIAKPGVIILDLMMPNVDGFELIYQLQKQPRWRSIPLVVITAKELTSTERDYLNSRVKCIFQKGEYDRSALLNEVQFLLSEALENPRIPAKAVSIQESDITIAT